MAKLSFEEFKSYTEAKFKDVYDVGFSKKIDRETGNILTGIIICLKGASVGIALTLNDYYKEVKADNSNLKLVTSTIEEDFYKAIRREPYTVLTKEIGCPDSEIMFNRHNFKNWNEARPFVRIDFDPPRIIDEDLCLNTALQKECSYYLDLFMPCLPLTTGYKMPITNKMVKDWGIDKDDLFVAGIENIHPKVELDEEKEEPALAEIEEKFKLPYPIMMIKSDNPVNSIGLLFTKNVKDLLENSVKNNCYMIPISDMGLLIVGRSVKLEKEISLEDLKKIISVYAERVGKETDVVVNKKILPPVIEFFAEPKIIIVNDKAFSIEDFQEVKEFDKKKELEKAKEKAIEKTKEGILSEKPKDNLKEKSGTEKEKEEEITKENVKEKALADMEK